MDSKSTGNKPYQDLDPSNIWVVIPAYNEEDSIVEVVAALAQRGYQIVVVDDGSTVELAPLLAETTAHICRHLLNLGQGAALQTGIRYALMHNAKYFVTFDADGQHNPDDLPRLLHPLERGECDIVLGSRFCSGGKALNIPPLRRTILRLATVFTRFTTGLALTDTHNGLRTFNAKAASRITITQNGMAHATQFLLEIKRHQLRYREVPVVISYTPYSLKKGQKLSNAFNLVWESMMELFR